MTPLILFAACDRHNFGDLLFPHIAAALQPDREVIVAGLVARDLTPWGGHRVAALSDLAERDAGVPPNILHAGGEILTCDAWQAAVMLQSPEAARDIIARYDRDFAARRAWARGFLGVGDLAPYTVSPQRFPGASIRYAAVGGVELAASPADLRAEVMAKLAAAEAISVRDRRTQAALQAAGLHAQLVPDPVALVAELFGERIARHRAPGKPAALAQAFPQGYLAVQFSADFGDDATLAALAGQIDAVASATGLGIVFFRAGAAPWHDDLDVYRRAAGRLRIAQARLFESLDIWDICALIAGSRGYCGSSLHGRIVAMAHALPRVNLVRDGTGGQASKQAAYARTWERPGQPGVVPPPELAAGLLAALAQEAGRLHAVARDCVAACRRAGMANIAVTSTAPQS